MEDQAVDKSGKSYGQVVSVDVFLTRVLCPETELEKTIITDAEFQEGAMWGVPRSGHPEGKVVFHIQDVLRNVDKYCNSSSYTTSEGARTKSRQDLRIIAFLHDTFKNKVDHKKNASGENHHAMIARRFAEKYIDDSVILDIIELHDEAYNAWCNGSRDGKWDKAEKRLDRLLDRLGKNVGMYTTFYRCDNEVDGKDQTNFIWFCDQLDQF